MNILITGANQGIGYYMVLELLEQGHNLGVLDLELENITKLTETYPNRVLPLECDVRDTDEIKRAVESFVDKYGSIDIAVHNACLCTFQSMENSDYETYDDVFNVNYFGALRLVKTVVPYMKKSGKGKIIFSSSGVGVTGFYNISPYASSKGAIEALTKCLNIEYEEYGITFHLFHPPLTKTKSASELPVPDEFLADPKVVGKGLAKRINKKSFYICHSRLQHFQMRLCYLFPIKMGKLMTKMTKRNKDK